MKIDDNMINFWLPLFISFIGVVLFIRPIYNYFNFEKDRLYIYTLILAGVVIFLTTTLSQKYLEKKTGKLTKIEKLSDLFSGEETMYYEMKNYYINETGVASYSFSSLSGKHKTQLDFHHYITLPIYNDKISSEDGTMLAAWIGMYKDKTIKNRTTDSIKLSIQNEFYHKNIDEILKTNFNRCTYFKRIKGDGLEYYEKAIKSSPRYDGGRIIVLNAINEPFENRTGSLLFWIIISFVFGSVFWVLLALIR